MIDALLEDAERGPATASERLNDVKLADLQSRNLPRASSTSIGLTATPKDPAHEAQASACIAAADEYLKIFLPPQMCPCCQRKHGFKWGLAHGEGHCRCGYPGRAHHDIPEVGRLMNLVLWYHPLEVAPKGKEVA